MSFVFSDVSLVQPCCVFVFLQWFSLVTFDLFMPVNKHIETDVTFGETHLTLGNSFIPKTKLIDCSLNFCTAVSVCKGWGRFATDVTADFCSFGLTKLSSEPQRLTILCVSKSAFKHKTSILTSVDDLKNKRHLSFISKRNCKVKKKGLNKVLLWCLRLNQCFKPGGLQTTLTQLC